jgi:hypothetical protein
MATRPTAARSLKISEHVLTFSPLVLVYYISAASFPFSMYWVVQKQERTGAIWRPCSSPPFL